MPISPKKQTRKPAKAKPKAKIATGSFLSQARSVADLEPAPIRALIYGPNRAGKTFLACSFPGPVLLLDFEPKGEKDKEKGSGGAESVRDFTNVKHLPVSSLKQLNGICTELLTDTHYQTVVVDSATSLQDLVLMEILQLDEAPIQLGFGEVSMDEYRERSSMTKTILRRFLGINADLVVTAKERDHNENKKTDSGDLDLRPGFVKPLGIQSYIAPSLGGGTADWVLDAFNYILRLYKDEKMYVEEVVRNKKSVKKEVATGVYVRHLLVSHHPQFAGGCRLGANRDSLPESGIIVEPTYGSIKFIFDR